MPASTPASTCVARGNNNIPADYIDSEQPSGKIKEGMALKTFEYEELIYVAVREVRFGSGGDMRNGARVAPRSWSTIGILLPTTR